MSRVLDADTFIAVETSPRHIRRGAGLLLAAGACLTPVAAIFVPVQAATATQNRALLTPHSAVSTYCAHLPASKVSSTVGATVSLREAIVVKTALECVYGGTVTVLISKESSMPASELATLAKAEATAAAGFPKGTKLRFSPLPSLSPTAFSWTTTINGGPFGGVANNKGTTGYGIELSGKLQLSKLERLLALGIAD